MFQHAPTYNEQLTLLAQAAVADETESILSLLFPAVEVTEAVGTYKKRDLGQAFRIYDTTIARDGDPVSLHVNAIDDFFNCKPNGLKISSWEFDSMTGGGEDWREDNLRELISTMLVNREDQAIKIWRAGVPATSGAGNGWSTGQGDPIAEIDAAIEMIHNAIGKKPTHIVPGLTTWKYIKNHPKVLSRIAGIDRAITPEQFAETLLIPGLSVRVASMPKNDAPAGAVSSMSGIVGSELYVFYSQDAPSRSDVSAAKEFTLDAAGPEIHTEELGLSTIDKMYWSSHMKVTCSASAARIVVS